MQDLNHVLWVEAHVELELFHVARMFWRRNAYASLGSADIDNRHERRHTSLELQTDAIQPSLVLVRHHRQRTLPNVMLSTRPIAISKYVPSHSDRPTKTTAVRAR